MNYSEHSIIRQVAVSVAQALLLPQASLCVVTPRTVIPPLSPRAEVTRIEM